MRFIFYLIVFLNLPYSIFAQSLNLRGKVLDTFGNPVPFASVFEQGTSNGTSANSEGEYHLKLKSGKHFLVFKAIGFSQELREMDLNSDQSMHVVLQRTVYQLSDVVVRAGAEDPAYAVIRNAIKKRKQHLAEPEQYTAEVYIKGMQKLLSAPRKFLGKNIDDLGRQIGLDSNRAGILYLSESESKISFLQPGKLKEEMISSRVSGSNRAFSLNRASDIRTNFYENLLDLEGISNRPFVSPIADNALFYYHYKLVGTSLENGEMINKIEVIPRRSSDPVFRGQIYILEDSWRIHSADLTVTKEANINFVDTLTIKQEFLRVDANIWMPALTGYEFRGKVLGFGFDGYFIALFKNYVLNPGLNKKNFDEVLKITSGVNKKDTVYWEQARPVPLTNEEQRDYIKKEILAKKRESESYLDSLDKVSNKFKPLSFLIGSGYNLRNRYKKENYNFSSLLNSVFYNTVEGFGINYQVSYTKRIDSISNKYLNYSGKLRYGLSSDKLYASFSGLIPLNSARLKFGLGSDVMDLNDRGSVTLLGNSINSLFYERNLLKLYEEKFVNLSFSKPFGSLQTSWNASWSNRRSLQNNADYMIRDLGRRQFTSNNPFLPLSDALLFPENQSLKVSMGLSYAFSNEYESHPSGKYYRSSKYPRLNINYTKGINGILGSDVNYDLLTFDLSKSDIRLGMFGKSSIWLGAGKFLNAESLYYPDYKHFRGNKTLTYLPGINSFLFLDYYVFSTSDRYYESHIEHNFSGFFMNKIPLLKKLKLTEIGGFNYLNTPAFNQYSEFYFGLKYLTLRALFGMSFIEGERMDRGFRIAYSF
ncbi:DUF5686 and carboxypeptidase regulatory-like domain-containing protein [Daejeonella sp. H1SJ63]|uniref:DUF5686 and carboxypeptidase regulatory-like domain-containing protein n=1 Tax=Daejeonella sp. H1SJ63 TaxID=3034145 RepID=UPI0023ECF267|nr:DUF5686 and carboxypeptidase regulatory-like domain-containing protein [Daejeonella sp. H1SJ63]